MSKRGILIAMLLTGTYASAQYIVRLEIKAFPPYHPSGADVYVAGSFNGWNPQDNNFRFSKDIKGNYFIDLKLDKGMYEYKISRGGWNKAECKKGGGGSENRKVSVESNQTISLTIEEWSDRFPAQLKMSTASKNVQIIDTAFVIPQLKRTRRIWIYLPESYSVTKQKYPVLYMQDGQNVFDDATSYSGEWGVDETLDLLGSKTRECIVVAVDHGINRRMNEYNPYDTQRSGKGEGDEYVDFLVKTLKPFIDKRYRTSKKKNDTFIAGSSMGGVISLYAVLKYPKIFGGAGIFSPAFWTASALQEEIKKKGRKVNSKIYFYAGRLEGERIVPDMLRMFEELNKLSRSVMTTVIRADGKHSEWVWRREFPLFYEWLVE